jgi:hypothetical protein
VLISAVEAAINAYSSLLDVTTGHPNAATLDVVEFGNNVFSLAFPFATTGGAFAAPTGESLKLTGLGLEVGITPRLHKRFPRT